MNEPNSASRPPLEPPGTFSTDNLETLEYLHRAIELADGFALFFARCDQPAQRDDLIVYLEALLARQGRFTRRLDVTPPAAGLLAGLQTVCRAASDWDTPACIHVCGLEEALPPGDPYPPVLRQLNLARDRFRDLLCPVVLWLPDAALTRLAQGAPDFWAWGSGTFDFVPGWVPLEIPLKAPVPDARMRAEERILVLENLLNDYRTLGDGLTEQRARAGLLVDLAGLYRATYRPQTARQRLKEALPLVRHLGDTALESRARALLWGLDADLASVKE